MIRPSIYKGGSRNIEYIFDLIGVSICRHLLRSHGCYVSEIYVYNPQNKMITKKFLKIIYLCIKIEDMGLPNGVQVIMLTQNVFSKKYPVLFLESR